MQLCTIVRCLCNQFKSANYFAEKSIRVTVCQRVCYLEVLSDISGVKRLICFHPIRLSLLCFGHGSLLSFLWLQRMELQTSRNIWSQAIRGGFTPFTIFIWTKCMAILCYMNYVTMSHACHCKWCNVLKFVDCRFWKSLFSRSKSF